MKVGIDVRMINHSGIGRYIRSLLSEYSKMSRTDTGSRKPFGISEQMPGEYSKMLQGNANARKVSGITAQVPGEIFLFGNPEKLREYKNFEVRKFNAPIYSISEQILLPPKIRKLPIFHSPHYNAPLLYSGKLIVTVHDIIHIKFPEYLASRKAYLYAKYMFKKVTEKAEKLITASEHTKSDIIEHFNVSPEKINVIPFGVDERFHSVEDEALISSFKEKFALPENFILYVGNLKSHKNLGTLLKAFGVLKKKKEIEESLVLTTGGKPADELIRQVCDEGIEKSVKFLPFIPDEELPLLYNCARVFVFPSLYEGFGLPLLEAMACGVPVVCSNSASIPEVVGEAAIMCDPEDCGAFADGMHRLLRDDSLRSKLTSEGMKRAKFFSWAETAKKTVEVYMKCV